VTVELVRLGTFLAFLLLGLAVRGARDPRRRRRAVNALAAYVLALSAFVGLSQWDDWPFSPYHILVGRGSLDTEIRTVQFWGLDAVGREWRIDPHAFSPLVELKLDLWFQREWDALPPEARARVLDFLLHRAEESRQELRAGRPIAHQRRLGRLAAPHWWLAPRPAQTAGDAYVSLRVYEARWTPRRSLASPGSVRRTLLAERSRE
jgi:hypothetical protein